MWRKLQVGLTVGAPQKESSRFRWKPVADLSVNGLTIAILVEMNSSAVGLLRLELNPEARRALGEPRRCKPCYLQTYESINAKNENGKNSVKWSHYNYCKTFKPVLILLAPFWQTVKWDFYNYIFYVRRRRIRSCTVLWKHLNFFVKHGAFLFCSHQ